MIVAYTRTYSNNKLSVNSQVETIEKFSQAERLTINKWYKESGNTPRNEKKTETIIRSLGEGDTLIISDISRLSRKLVDILHFLLVCIEQKIILYSLAEGYVFKEDENSKTRAFTFSIISEIEKKLISVRTKEALAVTRNKGVKLGRPKGSKQMESLMPYKERIASELKDENVTMAELANYYKVSISGFKKFVKENINNEKATGYLPNT